MGPDSGRPVLRSDAERNRAQIIKAARAAFAESGLEAPLHGIARRAGVGIGTLYRRFPTRGALIAAAFAAEMEEFAAAVDDAVAEPDPWTGFCRYVETMTRMQARDPGFRDLVTLSSPAAGEFETLHRRTYAGIKTLVERAQRAGALRADFVPEDIVMLLMANQGVIMGTARTAPRTQPRLVAYLLQAFAASGAGAPPPLPPPPSRRQIQRSLQRMNRSFGDPAAGQPAER
ncbi:MAG: TetR/AcrR family transcriptional regulator [Actinobacteria bacterium]|nr:TetR/AcrR family transcriptional regulator [Actinomycetota bacterium]